MNWFTRVKIFFLDLKEQKIEGYICTNESKLYAEQATVDNNTSVIEKYNVVAIRFTIPFLDKRNHWVDCYFIPKQAQEDLYFLTKLVRNIPMIAIFKKRKFIGFPKSQYEVIELWSSTAYREINYEQNKHNYEEDLEMMRQEEERAQEVARKHQEKLVKKAAIKEEKRLERERIKQEKLEQKKLEKEANKLGISVEKLKKQKEKEAKQASASNDSSDENKESEENKE